MKKFLIILLFPVSVLYAQQKVTLPNGWSLTPTGRSFALGDLPLNIAVSSLLCVNGFQFLMVEHLRSRL